MGILESAARILKNNSLPEGTLRDIARGYLLPAYARILPAAPFTKSTGVVPYDATVESVGPFSISFRMPVMITGINLVLTRAAFGGTSILDTRELEVKLTTSDGELNHTLREARGALATGDFVNASSLDPTIRNHMLVLEEGSDGWRIDFTFRGRYATAGSNGFGEAVRISADVFAVPLC